MMLSWIGFGAFMSYLTYYYSSRAGIIRNRPSFKTIRACLTIIPSICFPYYGIKFMIFYKNKGVR